MIQVWSALTRTFTSTPTCCKKMPNQLKGRTKSSQDWLIRQMNDPYVIKAKMENFRARSAFKLIEIDDKYKFLKPGSVVLECGSAPGAWTQVAVKRINANGQMHGQPIGKHIAIDLLPMYPVEGAEIVNLDFTKSEARAKINNLLDGCLVDVILSDMAPSASGVRQLDQDSIIELASSVAKYANEISKVGACLLIKLWNGGRIKAFEQQLGLQYCKVKIVKPQSSRQDSAELFMLATDFKSTNDT